MRNATIVPRLVVVLGSTGTGKSKLAVEIAKRFNGEIISTDSMQLYDGLDIITNKVTAEETGGIPHHLMSYLPPLTIGYTVADFRNKALSVLDDIASRNKLPILVGGTNYYIESILWKTLIGNKKLDANIIPDADSPSTVSESTMYPFYQDLPQDLITKSSEELHAILARVDPDMAAQFHPNNKRRIVRSLQVFYQEGRKHSELLREQHASGRGGSVGGPLRFPNCVALCVQCDAKILDNRLNERVDAMADKGLRQEITEFYDTHYENYQNLLRLFPVKNLLADDENSKGVFQCIGFKEFSTFLKLPPEARDSAAGQAAFAEGINLLKIATRQYARKQTRWIRSRFTGKPSREVPPVFALDASDLTQWLDNVELPALGIVETFLNGGKYSTDPLPISERPHDDERNKLFFCDLCKRHVQGATSWKDHLVSKKHRSLKKNAMLFSDPFGLLS